MGGRGATLSMRVVAGALSLAVIAVSGYAWLGYHDFVGGLNTITVAPVTSSSGTTATDIDGKDQNILIVGDDSRAGASAQSLAAVGTTANDGEDTDTIMVMHVPANGSKATVVSIPRDSWVDIPGFGMGKINSAFADGKSKGGGDGAGAALLEQVIYNLSGLKIDHFVKVTMFGFYDITEAIGGVNLCLTAAQNASTEGDATHPNGYTGINLKKGWNYNVKGTQAVAFVRQRHGLSSDLARINRQRYFLSAVFRKVATPATLANPTKVNRLIKAVSKSLEVDKGLAGDGLLKLAGQMAGLTAGNLTFVTIPITNLSYTTPDGQSAVQVDATQVTSFAASLVGAPGSYAKAALLNPAQVSVQVINDSNKAGAAAKNVAALAGFHFTAVVGPTEAGTIPFTTIYYAPGMESQARTLAKYVPGVKVIVSHSVTKLTLTLGTNGKQAKGLSTSKSSNDDPTAPRTAAQADCIP